MARRSNQDSAAQKRRAALAALEYIEPKLTNNTVVGIGTGSTTNCFIDLLARIRHKFDAAVASSTVSADRLETGGIRVLDLNAVDAVTVYVDGADEVAPDRCLIKGGGGALTREKIIAASAEEFVCIVDEGKCVDRLGAFPLPVEVVPMARGLVGRALAALGGEPVYRAGFKTDNGNVILDVRSLTIDDPAAMESTINNIVGVVCNGVFAAQAPDIVLVAGAHSVRRLG